jgi:hypothetical protein
MRYLLIVLLFPLGLLGQTVTLTPIGNQDVSGIPIEVEHYVNYIPNHAISSTTYSPQSTAGTSVGLSDDSNVGPFNIGFNFEFYGQTFTQFRICTNGFITFGDPSGRYSPGSFPDASAPNGVVAAYWTDLYPSSGYYMRYQTVGTAPNRQLIVSAHLTWYSNRNAWVDYQIVLFEGSNKIWTTITSQGWTSRATQGVENHTGTLAATPPGRNLSSFNGAGTTYEYAPQAAIAQWESQGVKSTNTSGQVSFANNSNWDYKVTIDVSSKFHTLTDVDMNYLMYKKANLSPITDWDFYTCDINNSSTFDWDDIDFGYTLWSQGHQHNKYIFTQSEKTAIESNPTVNYYNTYFPVQIRTIQDQNQFYIMGTGKHKTTISNLYKITQ